MPPDHKSAATIAINLIIEQAHTLLAPTSEVVNDKPRSHEPAVTITIKLITVQAHKAALACNSSTICREATSTLLRLQPSQTLLECQTAIDAKLITAEQLAAILNAEPPTSTVDKLLALPELTDLHRSSCHYLDDPHHQLSQGTLQLHSHRLCSRLDDSVGTRAGQHCKASLYPSCISANSTILLRQDCTMDIPGAKKQEDLPA